MTTKLDRIAAKAKSGSKLRFTALAHLLTPEFLLETWKQMNRRGASGADGEAAEEFEVTSKSASTRCTESSGRVDTGRRRYGVSRFRSPGAG
jgi:hypothetical protein